MPNLSKFDLSHEVKTSFEMGDLIPIQWLDVVPGDEIRSQTRSLIRLQPLIAPVLHKLDFYTRFYYVPYRLLMKNFEKMLIDPDSPLVVPTVYDVLKDEPGFSVGVSLSQEYADRPVLDQYNLLRQFGIHSSDSKLPVEAQQLLSVFPFYAYQLIYNYFYKDPILDSSYKDVFDPSVDFDNSSLFALRPARYSSDYFTSTLPNTQYGSAVDIDMDGNGTVKVSEMQLAEKLQNYKERQLLKGARYIDYLKEFFDVAPSNAMLQQPLYIGGGISPISVSDVDQMVSDDSNPLGNVAGKSVSVCVDNNYQLSVKEHGIILGLGFIKPRQSYLSGIPRSFIKKDFYSFYNPTFSTIGMQETYGAELSAERNDTFGYNERYAELKYANDVVAGDLSSTLQHWHFGRDLRSERLSNSFLFVTPPTDPFAVSAVNVSTFAQFEWRVYSSGNDCRYVLCRVGSGGAPVPDDFVLVNSNPAFRWIPTLYVRDNHSDFLLCNANDFRYWSSNGGSIVPEYRGDETPIPLTSLFGMSKDPNYREDVPTGFDYSYFYSGGDTSSFAFPVDGKYFLEGKMDDGTWCYVIAGKNPVMVTSSVGTVTRMELIGSDYVFDLGDGVDISVPSSFRYTNIPSDLFVTKDSVSVNHCLAVIFNDVDALRPIPKIEKTLI